MKHVCRRECHVSSFTGHNRSIISLCLVLFCFHYCWIIENEMFSCSEHRAHTINHRLKPCALITASAICLCLRWLLITAVTTGQCAWVDSHQPSLYIPCCWCCCGRGTTLHHPKFKKTQRKSYTFNYSLPPSKTKTAWCGKNPPNCQTWRRTTLRKLNLITDSHWGFLWKFI